MKNLLYISLILGVASAASMYDKMRSLVMGDSAGYGSARSGEEQCYPTFETKYREQCEDYFEKVCYTTQKEQCHDVVGKKCKAIQTSAHERKCFDVPELLCSLKEDVQYEEVPAIFTVQKCQKVTERVCDTIYDTEMAERDDFKCIDVVNPYCTTKEFTVYDNTCRTVTNFDCKAQGYGDVAAGYGDAPRGSFGGGSQDSYTAGSQDSYGRASNANQYTCKRTPETKCYSTPRTVSQEQCEDRKEKVCEKLTERVPVPSEKQNCHDEQKKVCELEQKSQPKQVKKYVYTKHCRPVPKTVCDNVDQKSLQPSCVPMSRKQCSYSPEERCENIPKKHCFKIPYQVKTMQCGQDRGSEGGFANRGLNDNDRSQGGYTGPATMGQEYGSDGGFASRGLNDNDHSQGDSYAGRTNMESQMMGQFQSSMDELPRSEGSYATNQAIIPNEY